VAPFRGAFSRRGYFVSLAPHAARNPDAQAFADWLLQEARSAAVQPPARRTRRR
jgi:hypothetical protein